MSKFIITIDGPAGAGKSTAAKQLSHLLGWRYLDTGAMFRAVTFVAQKMGCQLCNESELSMLVSGLTIRMPPCHVIVGHDGTDEDITEAIRSPEVSRGTGPVASSPSVRKRLAEWQREFAEQYDVVAEGRDLGTKIFPNATLKYYFTASDEVRARRRVAEYHAKGQVVGFEETLTAIRQRDQWDLGRTIAPMRPAADAIMLDTTGLTTSQVVDRMFSDILRLINRR
jgi:cytidylate kinase